MAKSKEKKDLTVKWVIGEDELIRFAEHDEADTLSSNLAKMDFEKAGFNAGAKVTVEFEEVEGKKVVSNLTLIKGTEPVKEDQNQEESKGNLTTFTVSGYSLKYKGITFKEDKDVWYDVVDEIGIENLEKMGIKKGVKVRVKIGEPGTGKSKNKRILEIQAIVEGVQDVGEPGKPSNDVKEDKPINDFDTVKNNPKNDKDAFYIIKKLENQIQYLQNEKTDSIEANSAVERAFSLVGDMIQNESAESNVKNKEMIKSLVKEYSKLAYDLIQELKKKS